MKSRDQRTGKSGWMVYVLINKGKVFYMKRRNIVVAAVAIGCCICACAYILRLGMKPVPRYRASCRFVYAPSAVLTNSPGVVSKTPDYSGDRSHIMSRLNEYATRSDFKCIVRESCARSCLLHGVAQDKVARAIVTVGLSMVDDSIPLFEVAAISDDERVAVDVVKCYIDALAQFDQHEQEKRVAEGLKVIGEGVCRKKREVAKIDAKIASAEVSDKLNLDDLRREGVAIADVIKELEADGRRIREQELRSRWRLQKVGDFVVKKL